MVGTLFSFEGRINRRPLWGFWLFSTAVSFIAIASIYFNLSASAWSGHATQQEIAKAAQSVSWLKLANLALLWPTLALGIKRAHDRNHSGWYLLLMLIPLFNVWVIFELACLAGTPGINRFGSDPLPSVKPGLGWLILIGYLIIIALSTVQFKTQAVVVDLFTTPRRDMPMAPKAAPKMAPQPNTQGLRPSSI
ncbi:MAG: DUF805 domain-containing protein [Parvibaculaceae bacterium]